MKFNESVYKLTGKVFLEKKEEKNSSSFYELTIPHGFIFHPDLQRCLNLDEANELILKISECSSSYSDWTRTFFKNWEKVEKQTDFSFAFHQMIHYLSTYYSDTGFIDSEEIYIPNTEVDSFSMKDYLNAPLKVLKLISKEEVEEVIVNLISSGIALSQETTDDILHATIEVGINPILFLKNSKNREFSCLVRKRFNILPDHPLDFLRQVVYIATGKTLLIKDKDTIEAIKNSKEAKDWLNSYCIQVKGSMVELSKYFYRFKPLILAMKDERTTGHVNRIRRLAKKNHIPMGKDFLNSITDKIRNHLPIDYEVLEKELRKAPAFRLCSLYMAVSSVNSENHVYRIRNGKVWAEKELKDSKENYNHVLVILMKIRRILLERLNENVSGKKIFIPSNISYAIPTSEKDFVGFIPCGSYVAIDPEKSALIGVHWENRDGKIDSWGSRVDLDLSMISLTEKIGWDRCYRNSDLGVWFSGDIASAPLPDGATEFFRINGKKDLAYSVYLNSFTGNKADYDLLIGEMNSEDKDKIFVPSAKIFQYQSSLENSKLLGLYVQKNELKRFYFSDLRTSEGRTSRNSDYKKVIIEKYLESLDSRLILNEVLHESEAILVNDPKEADIDLSANSLGSDSIIKLFI